MHLQSEFIGQKSSDLGSLFNEVGRLKETD